MFLTDQAGRSVWSVCGIGRTWDCETRTLAAGPSISMPGKIGKVKIIKKPPALKPVAESGGMEEYIPNISKSFKYIQVYLESSRHGQLAELTCVLMPSYALCFMPRWVFVRGEEKDEVRASSHAHSKILCQDVPKKWNLGPDFDRNITIFSLGRMWLNYQMRGTKLDADADDPVLVCCQKHQVTATQGGDHTAEGWDAGRQEGSKGLGEGATEAVLGVFAFIICCTKKDLCQEMRRICRQMKKERPDLRKARATCGIMQHAAGIMRKPKGFKKVWKTSQLSEPQVRRCTRKKPPSCQAIFHLGFTLFP